MKTILILLVLFGTDIFAQTTPARLKTVASTSTTAYDEMVVSSGTAVLARVSVSHDGASDTLYVVLNGDTANIIRLAGGEVYRTDNFKLRTVQTKTSASTINKRIVVEY